MPRSPRAKWTLAGVDEGVRGGAGGGAAPGAGASMSSITVPWTMAVAIRGAAPATSSMVASRISRVSAVLPKVSPSRATDRMMTEPSFPTATR